MIKRELKVIELISKKQRTKKIQKNELNMLESFYNELQEIEALFPSNTTKKIDSMTKEFQL